MLLPVKESDSVSPGSGLTLVYKVTNTSTDTLHVDLTVNLPKGMEAVVPISRMVLPSKKEQLVFVSLKVPKFYKPGDYLIPLWLRFRGYEASSKVVVHVLPMDKLTLSKISVSENVMAGDTIKANFLLKNMGNIPRHVRLIAKGGHLDSSEELILAPGQEEIIKVSGMTSKDLITDQQGNIKLEVRPLDHKGAVMETFAFSYISSRYRFDRDGYLRFPVEMDVGYVGHLTDKLDDGFQLTGSGGGYIDDKNRHLLRFMLRTPNPVRQGVFVQNEEYYLQYQSRKFGVFAGDKVYSSSRLTENSRYGRGVEFLSRSGNFELGGFYQSPRFYKDLADEEHLYMKFGKEPYNYIKAGYLRKGYDDGSAADLYFLNFKSTPFKNFLVEGELANNLGHGRSGRAYMFSMSTALDRFRFRGMYLKANPLFSGFIRDTDQINLSLDHSIAKRFSISASYTKAAVNTSRDTLYGNAPYSENIFLNGMFRFAKRSHLKVELGHLSREDRGDPMQFNYGDDYLRSSVALGGEGFLFTFAGQKGRTTNYLTGSKGETTVLDMKTAFESRRFSLELFAQRLQSIRFSKDTETKYVFGGNFRADMENTGFELGYQNTYLPDESYRDRNLLYSKLEQKLSRFQSFSLLCRYATRQRVSKPELSFSVRYVHKVGIPIKRIGGFGSLSGSIVNLGVDHTSGIRLLIGDRECITDSNGNFSLNEIRTGSHTFRLDHTSLELEDIADIPMPFHIEIQEDLNWFSFGLTKAGSVHGKVAVGDFRGTSDEPNHLKVRIELSNGKDSYVQVCGADKPFIFSYLRPGIWKVKIDRLDADVNYVLASNEKTLDVVAGGTAILDVRFEKRRRVIQFQSKPLTVNPTQVH
jgi:hypothetical protein